jgi:hemerythrin superfamily protein
MSDTKVRVRKATSLLREDHQKVKKLFTAFEKIDEDDVEKKAELFDEIRTELTIHARIEEEIFYQAIEGSGDREAVELVKKSREEHRLVKKLLEELSETPDSGDFEAKLQVLKENVLLHVEQEQENIFPCFDALDKEARDRVSESLASRKRELSRDEDIEDIY